MRPDFVTRDSGHLSEHQGYLGWLRERTDKVTVHHIAALSRKRVRDVEFILSCEGIPVDYDLRTVKLDDLLERWPNA